MAKLNVATDETFPEEKAAVLEEGSDETGIKQNNSEVSVSQEETSGSKNHELNADTTTCPVDVVGEMPVLNETNVDATTETLVAEVLPENELTVTS